MKRFWLTTPIIAGLLCLIAGMTVFSGIVADHRRLLLINVTVTAFAFIAVVFLSERVGGSVYEYLVRLAGMLSSRDRAELESSPVAVVSVTGGGEIIWYNGRFRSDILEEKDVVGKNLRRVFENFDTAMLANGGPFDLHLGDKTYSCSVKACAGEDAGKYIIYFSDISYLKKVEKDYLDTRPGVILVMFDNAEEIRGERESEGFRVISEVERLINQWVADSSGVCWADARDKSLIILPQTELDHIIADKFSLLSDVRKILIKETTPATVSIGVGMGGDTLSESESYARQALDMSLGRGGDQAAVRTSEGYTFYGGVTNSSERQSRVRMRMFATSLADHLKGCENCFVTGHRFSDLDSVGACVGLYSLARMMNKEAFIVVDRETCLAKDVLDEYEKTCGKGIIISPPDALDRIRSGSLTIVADTHSPGLLESRALYDRATKRIVIDHHRMTVDKLQGADLFIHELSASSTCEMVTELASYISDKAVGRAEAESLLAGIMLDTKNFIFKTGVRTFEAAAFLRRRGADSTEVKRFFSDTLDHYIEKSRLVSNAAVYRKCAISYADETARDLGNDMRIVAAQSADEMLDIKDVEASFTLFEQNHCVNISARSLGKVNVQVIMEKLGGGGHLTMAGAQLKDIPVEDGLAILYDAIDAYFDS